MRTAVLSVAILAAVAAVAAAVLSHAPEGPALPVGGGERRAEGAMEVAMEGRPGLVAPRRSGDPDGGAASGGDSEVEPATTPFVEGTVVDPQGRPVAGARVGIWRGEAETLSGADGRFRLAWTEPAGAPWALRARGRGFAEVRVGGVSRGDRAVRIVLEPGVSISGRVLDPEGRPARGIRVGDSRTPAPKAPEDGASAESAHLDPRFDGAGWTLTDGTGAFTLSDLVMGVSYPILAARSGDWALVDHGWVKAPAEGLLLRLRAGGTLEGLVQDAAGHPVAGARVRSDDGTSVALAFDTGSDSAGRFEARGLVPGEALSLRVTAPGFALLLRRGVLVGGPALALVLEEERPALLRIVDKSGAGAPLAPRSILIRRSDGGETAYDWRMTDEGDVSITGIGAGLFLLVAETEGRERVVVEGFRGGGPRRDVRVGPAHAIAGTYELAGATQDSLGLVDVYAVPAGQDGFAPSRDPWAAFATDDGFRVNGRFHVGSLGSGAYDLLAVAASGLHGEERERADVAGAVVTGVRAGTVDLRIALERGFAISGTARGKDGLPADVLVQAYDARGLCRAATRSERGDFRLGGLPGGRYDLVAWWDEVPRRLAGVLAPSEGMKVEGP